MGCLGTCLDCRFLSGGLRGYFFHRAFGSNCYAKCTSYPRRVTNSSKRRDIKPETGFAQLLCSGIQTGLGRVSHKAAVKLLVTSATPWLKSARGRGGGWNPLPGSLGGLSASLRSSLAVGWGHGFLGTWHTGLVGRTDHNVACFPELGHRERGEEGERGRGDSPL